jgi:thioester reductase-like protein
MTILSQTTLLVQEDACLPCDIVPAGEITGLNGTVLLTGVTGFLGRQLFRELLSAGYSEIICLIRAGDDSVACSRLNEAISAGGINSNMAGAKVRALCGNVAQTQFGMSPQAYAELAAQVEVVYHCAAEVNWVKSYKQLRQTNVLGTIELLRFACHSRTKALTFVSSLAVCFARGGSTGIDESTDMMAWLESMPLGYAQSKCVAESLLRQAAARGLPVTIVRPGLLSGDTLSGITNPTDLVAALMEACVRRREAPDADWLFDSVPVDYAARAIVALSRARLNIIETYHLRHERPRHWRELILWLNLFGYPIQLIPTRQWLERYFQKRNGMLSSYRKFFLGKSGIAEGERPFEVYLAQMQTSVSCDMTCRLLKVLGVIEPVLDSDLLRRYMDHYVKAGVLPSHPWGTRGNRLSQPSQCLQEAVSSTMGMRHYGLSFGEHDWVQMPFDAGNGLLNEIAAIRLETGVGMHRFHVGCSQKIDSCSFDILVKAKAEDTVMHGLVTEVAELCDSALGRSMRAFRQALGLERSHLREPALYRTAPASILEHMPQCYGVVEDCRQGIWSVAMEHLSDAEFIDIADETDRWLPKHRDAAIQGAAYIHSAWYGVETQLRKQYWLAPEILPADIHQMSSLWYSLANFSDQFFTPWAGTSLFPLQLRFIETMESWWDELAAMPQTLIHNDFNPRNLAFRGADENLKLCAFDWELARIGVPQHDLAELLCFTFNHQAGRAELLHCIDSHRIQLSVRTGAKIEPDAWIRGFVLALQHLLVERIPFYTMAHRFKPQPFLPKVIKNWVRIYDMSLALSRVHNQTASLDQ